MKVRHRIILALVLAAFMAWPLKASCADEILIGLIPEENIFNQMARHRPLAAYLSKKIGTKVRFTILSRFGVFTSVLAMDKIDAEPIARTVNLNGSASVQSYVFVRKDSGISGVQDMKGKRIAFVDRATVTGYLFALSYLREKGVGEPEAYFRDVSFTGSHGSTIYSVLDGRADIGTAKSKIFEMLVAKDHTIKEELAIIAKSREFPENTLFLRKDFSPTVRAQIKAALLGMNSDPEGKEVLKKLEAQMFLEAKKDDFLPFYEVARKAGINVKTYRYK
jgi:phosphonate transport system substrate-binding protein